MKYYFSVCAIFKDEADYLDEWIKFHHLVGAQNFYLYNNNSTDNYEDLLSPYIAQGLVDLTEFPHNKDQQRLAYIDMIKKAKGESKWVACIDIDEFLFCPDMKKVPDLLKEYEDYSALCVNWLIYGSSGHDQEPQGNVVDNYIMHAEKSYLGNDHIKSIIQPEKTIMPRNGHCFEFSEGYAVNENFESVSDSFSKHSTEKIRLNHYFCKSRQYYQTKIDKGRVDIQEKRSWSNFNALDKNEIKDRSASNVYKNYLDTADFFVNHP